MQCSLDSGLIVVVFIISCLLWVVGLLLFYDFGNICDKAAAVSNDSSMVRLNVFRAAYMSQMLYAGQSAREDVPFLSDF